MHERMIRLRALLASARQAKPEGDGEVREHDAQGINPSDCGSPSSEWKAFRHSDFGLHSALGISTFVIARRCSYSPLSAPRRIGDGTSASSDFGPLISDL